MTNTPRTNGLHTPAPTSSNPTSPVQVLKKDVSESAEAAIDTPSLKPDEMKKLIENKIQNLPPLPKTITEINKLKSSDEFDNNALLKIILTDPMIVANILKVSNSAIYGFGGRVKTTHDAIMMLGFTAVANIALSTAIVGYLKPDLKPYGIDMESFTSSSSLQSKLIKVWKEAKIKYIKADLEFAAFMQEVGVIVNSIIITDKDLNLTEKFMEALKVQEQHLAEEAILGQYGSMTTSMVFAHWKFNQNTIEYIRHADRPESADEEYKIASQALKIVKTLAPV
jgi:HD-like signal output (HDOD) protein